MLPLSVYGYFLNGGSLAYIVRVPNAEPSGEPARLALPGRGPLARPADLGGVRRARRQHHGRRRGCRGRRRPRRSRALQHHDRRRRRGRRERYDDLTLGGPRDAATVINKTSKRVKVEVKLAEDVDLTSQLELLEAGRVHARAGAAKPVPVNGRKFAGSESARTGIAGLAIADDVTIVLVPDLVTAATKEDGSLDLGLWKAVQTSLIAHCEQHANRVAILDAPPGLTPQAVKEWRTDTAQFDSAFATLYYPWIKVENPTGSNGNSEILIPPSGHVAGVWARTDETRGVWKAPGQRHHPWRPGRRAKHHAGRAGHAQPAGHQRDPALRPRGIRIWGARTLRRTRTGRTSTSAACST